MERAQRMIENFQQNNNNDINNFYNVVDYWGQYEQKSISSSQGKYIIDPKGSLESQCDYIEPKGSLELRQSVICIYSCIDLYNNIKEQFIKITKLGNIIDYITAEYILIDNPQMDNQQINDNKELIIFTEFISRLLQFSFIINTILQLEQSQNYELDDMNIQIIIQKDDQHLYEFINEDILYEIIIQQSLLLGWDDIIKLRTELFEIINKVTQDLQITDTVKLSTKMLQKKLQEKNSNQIIRREQLFKGNSLIEIRKQYNNLAQRFISVTSGYDTVKQQNYMKLCQYLIDKKIISSNYQQQQYSQINIIDSIIKLGAWIQSIMYKYLQEERPSKLLQEKQQQLKQQQPEELDWYKIVQYNTEDKNNEIKKIIQIKLLDFIPMAVDQQLLNAIRQYTFFPQQFSLQHLSQEEIKELNDIIQDQIQSLPLLGQNVCIMIYFIKILQ
ncbi:hypothetical protein ABPG72_018975 [Tetrahymena utriculariae]